MTLQKAAQILGCTTTHIRDLRKRGLLKFNTSTSGARKYYDITMTADELREVSAKHSKMPGGFKANRKARKQAKKLSARDIPRVKRNEVGVRAKRALNGVDSNPLKTVFADALWFAKLDSGYKQVLMRLSNLSIIELNLLLELAEEAK